MSRGQKSGSEFLPGKERRESVSGTSTAVHVTGADGLYHADFRSDSREAS